MARALPIVPGLVQRILTVTTIGVTFSSMASPRVMLTVSSSFKGGSTCESITLSQKLEFPGAIQWFDKYLAVGDQEAGAIYHFAIHGTNAKEIGTTELGGSSDVVQFYIQKPYVAGADAGNEDVELWKYPAGGPIFKTLQGSFDLPIGLIVSVGKKR